MIGNNSRLFKLPSLSKLTAFDDLDCGTALPNVKKNHKIR